MGLMVHTLNEIPEDISRSFYIYLLDYGWKEPLSEVIMKNWEKISDLASKTKSVFIKGTIGSHVDTEILSWHHINGESGDKILPAILITTENPHVFSKGMCNSKNKIILIPLKKMCKTNSDVVELISKIFKDIESNKKLPDFSVYKNMKKGIGNRLLDGVILQPNAFGIGFDFKKFFD